MAAAADGKTNEGKKKKKKEKEKGRSLIERIEV